MPLLDSVSVNDAQQPHRTTLPMSSRAFVDVHRNITAKSAATSAAATSASKAPKEIQLGVVGSSVRQENPSMPLHHRQSPSPARRRADSVERAAPVGAATKKHVQLSDGAKKSANPSTKADASSAQHAFKPREQVDDAEQNAAPIYDQRTEYISAEEPSAARPASTSVIATPWAKVDDGNTDPGYVKKRSSAADRMLGSQAAPWMAAPDPTKETSASGFEVARAYDRPQPQSVPWADDRPFDDHPPPPRRPSSSAFRSVTPWAETDGEIQVPQVQDARTRRDSRSSSQRTPWASTDGSDTRADAAQHPVRPQSTAAENHQIWHPAPASAPVERPSSARSVLLPTPWAPTDAALLRPPSPVVALASQPPWRTEMNDRPGSSGAIVSSDGSVMHTRAPAGRAYTVVEMALDPSIAANMEMRRRGLAGPKNHLQDNVKKLREMQAAQRARKEAEKQAAQSTPVKVNEYAHVPSRVMTAMEEPCSGGDESRGRQGTPYLRAHSRSGPSSTDANPVTRRPGSANRASSVERSRGHVEEHAVEREVIRHETPRQRSNSVGGARPASPAHPADGLSGRSTRPGEIPKYLIDRKMQWVKEEMERKANIPDPNCPPGHVELPEQDRKFILSELNEQHSRILDEFKTVSVTSDTMRAKTKRTLLETKLAELEDNIKFYSRSKVYVPRMGG